MSAKGYLVAVVALLGLMWLTTANGDETTQGEWSRTVTQPASTYPAARVAPAPAPAPARVPTFTVTRVIDGDSFELTDGTQVRVLGIDSCEMSTPGGQDAKATAESWLMIGRDVHLAPEPGVDKDQYGRLLRYVMVDSTDFAKTMVGHDHTGVYQGRNDARPDYVAELRSLDTGGRTCTGPPPVTQDDDHYVPAPDSDDDGESRFCRKRRWC